MEIKILIPTIITQFLRISKNCTLLEMMDQYLKTNQMLNLSKQAKELDHKLAEISWLKMDKS